MRCEILGDETPQLVQPVFVQGSAQGEFFLAADCVRDDIVHQIIKGIVTQGFEHVCDMLRVGSDMTQGKVVGSGHGLTSIG